MSPMPVFWLVWRTGGSPPVVAHHSQASAEREARRLAVRVPGATFVVLQVVSAFRAEIPEAQSVPIRSPLVERVRDEGVPF